MSQHEVTVLLVEDDFLNRRYTKKVLTETGYHVVEAKNGAEALRALQQHRIDVAILDINLGEKEMDGVNLGQYIAEVSGIPFLYLTAYETAEVIRRAVDTGPYSYLTKPLKKADLIAALEIVRIKSDDYEADLQDLMVREQEFNVQINVADIDFIESDGNYLKIHCGTKIYRYRSTIRQLYDTLPGKIFVQVHRAFMVNVLKIEKFNNRNIIIGNKVIPVSKNYWYELKEHYDN